MKANYTKDNEKIFTMFKPDENNYFSDMTHNDIREFLYLLDQYYLTLREKLYLGNSITFGLEIETEKADNKSMTRDLYDYGFTDKGWIIDDDTSLLEGAEVISPILKDIKKTWKDVDEVCSLISKHAYILDCCGAHIHVGAHILGNNTSSWLKLLKLWSTYENIIYKFVYGEYVNYRPFIKDFALPVSKEMWAETKKFKKYKTKEKFFESLKEYINCGIQFNYINPNAKFEVNNTIEFRCPNGTLDPVIWQNNLNLFVSLLKTAKYKDLNDREITSRHLLNSQIYNKITSYNVIDLEAAFELIDLIYDKNIDKIYFMRQYIKSFDFGYDELRRVKFTKKIK